MVRRVIDNMYTSDELIKCISINKGTIDELESHVNTLKKINERQKVISNRFINTVESLIISDDSKKYNLAIYPNYKCDAKCYYCEMKKQPEVDLNINQVESFLLRNRNSISFDQVKLVTGEDINIRYSWVETLAKYFKSINVATKLICEHDIDWLINMCERFNLVLNVSYLNMESLNKSDKLLKYIISIEFVLNDRSLYELYDVVKWCNDKFIRLNIIPEVNITHISNRLKYDDALREFLRIDKELGLIMVNQYRAVAYDGGDRCDDINKLMIDPYGDIYCCSACSTFFKSNPEMDAFGNISDYHLSNIKQNKITEIFDVNNDCDNCNNKCPAKCSVYKMNDETFNNMCTFYKVLYKLTKNLNISRPESMLPFLTTNCTLYCDYCFEHGADSAITSHMPSEVLLSCIKYGVLTDHDFEVSLFGGEPTLNVKALEELCDFLEHRCRYDRLSISIQSNLVYVNERVLNAFRRLSKCTTFRIDTSIDGCKTAHDLYRKNKLGEGSYDKVISNIKKIKSELPNVQILAKGVMTKDIMPYFVESLTNAIDLRMGGWIDDYMYTWFKGEDDEMMPNDNDLQKLVNDYFDIVMPYAESKNFSIGELGVTSLGLDYYFNSSKTDDGNSLLMNIRGSNSRTHIVTPDGTILPCEMFTNKDIYYQSSNYPNILFDGHFKKSIDDQDVDICELKCFGCDLNYYCSRYMNHFKYQYDSQPNNVECSRRRKLLKMIYPMLSNRINKLIEHKMNDACTYLNSSKINIINLATSIVSQKKQ